MTFAPFSAILGDKVIFLQEPLDACLIWAWEKPADFATSGFLKIEILVLMHIPLIADRLARV